jgi:uncharacterized protein (DUF488 family)
MENDASQDPGCPRYDFGSPLRRMKPRITKPIMTVMTIGHSTHPVEEFISMLQAHGVDFVADVRQYPGSRAFPEYNQGALRQALRQADIGYAHLTGLGGRRRPRKDSTNTAWESPGFRGYADYMQTDDFDQALEGLIELSRDHHVAIMCAEALPWRCHRALISDALTARGFHVCSIFSRSQIRDQPLTVFARVRDRHITYPAARTRARSRVPRRAQLKKAS